MPETARGGPPSHTGTGYKWRTTTARVIDRTIRLAVGRRQATPASDPLGRIGPADRPERCRSPNTDASRRPPAQPEAGTRATATIPRLPCRYGNNPTPPHPSRAGAAHTASRRRGTSEPAPQYSDPPPQHTIEPARTAVPPDYSAARTAPSYAARLSRRRCRTCQRLPRLQPALAARPTPASGHVSLPIRSAAARNVRRRIRSALRQSGLRQSELRQAIPMPIRAAGPDGQLSVRSARLRRRGLSGCAGPAGLCAAALSARAGSRRDAAAA